MTTEQQTAGHELTATPETDTSRGLATVIMRVRHIIAEGIRGEIPWEILPMAQVEILQNVERMPGLRLSDLAYRQRLAVNTVSTLTKEMANKGLIERRPDERDRRVLRLHTTERGREMVEQFVAATSSFIASGLRRMDDDALQALGDTTALLHTLASALEDNYSASFGTEHGGPPDARG
ncbi:MarR family winged helix-turn-helix transcriptional regulator [Microbacterium karelineae]|uniref:MarR family winged helix-turn-helix transcriptional regulator n=1 Tax=Microbacterium karelineae TaxID=2654283 RepID=UPI0018D3089A|nr:MarR family winged helix-turn-helix transcriptional regulator [Microbacterium karelineae]